MMTRIKDLFTLLQGNGYELINMNLDNNSNINFVSRTSINNGVVASVLRKEKEPFKAGLITVALSGSVLSSFVQDKDFYTSFHVMVLLPKTNLSIEQKLFYCMEINKNAYRYNYGRQANKTLKNLKIPTLEECNNFIKDYRIKYIKTENINKISNLNIYNWGKYSVKELFSYAKRGQLQNLEEIKHGKIPVVSSKENNNGVVGKYAVKGEYKKSITVSFNGACGFFSYHDKSFNATNDVAILQPKVNINKYTALFLLTVLNKISNKYQYGRKLNWNRLKKEQILLPISNNNPDWQFMEDYIKSLPFADRI